jgi:DNA polymerase III delta subunit
MATYSQFSRLFHDKDELKRMYYLHGPAKVLVEEVLDDIRARVDPRDDQYVQLSGDQKPADLWSALSQYPIDTKHTKLVVVRDAHKIKKWQGFISWAESREMPRTYVVFVGDDAEVDTKQPYFERLQRSGRIVRCTTTDEEAVIAYMRSRVEIDRSTAKFLYERVGFDFDEARNVILKLQAIGRPADLKLVMWLAPASAVSDFVVELMARRKASAVDAIPRVPEEMYSQIVGALDWRLDAASRLWRVTQRRRSMQEILSETGLKPHWVKELSAIAKYYDKKQVVRSTKALAFVDDQLLRGERQGILETLVLLW